MATAMMDLSDGLSSDLPRLCAASGVGAKITAASLPVAKISSGNVQDRQDLLNLGLHGGDDYELLFTVSRKNFAKIPGSIGGVPLTRIGEITAGRKILLVEEAGRESDLIAGGWDPFRLAAGKVQAR
jgi:thiamine-monophosphate kinase